MCGMNKWKGLVIGSCGLVLLGVLPLAVHAARSEKKPSPVDAAQYADFMATQPRVIQDLADEAEAQRSYFDRITPPGIRLTQPMMPPVVPFDDADFANSFLEGLLGEDVNSVAVYPLSICLDPLTCNTLFFNADGRLIATLPGEKSSRTTAADSDPSRVTLLLDLLPAEDVEPFLYAESRIEESIQAASLRSLAGSSMTLKSLGPAHLGVSAIQPLTGMHTARLRM